MALGMVDGWRVLSPAPSVRDHELRIDQPNPEPVRLSHAQRAPQGEVSINSASSLR